MNGGCFGKILTFILGIVVGIVLIAGTLAGVVYYAVAGVTLNDVEKIADTKFEVVDKDADIRDKSLIEIFNMVKNGEISNLTVDGAKKTFGIDIISIIENTLDISIDDENKAELQSVQIMQLFQGDNVKKILNCVTLRSVFDKAGIDTSTGLGAKPILQEHIDEPFIDGLNALMTSLEINDMTIAEMEYLLGISFGGEGVLDSLESYKISDLNDAINDITFEALLPDFDRDMYINVLDGTFNKGALTAFTSYKSLITEGYIAIRADGEGRLAGTTYYSFDADNGILKEDEAGNYYVATGKILPDFRSRYSGKVVSDTLDISTLEQNRFGIYYLDATGVMDVNRYDADGTTQNKFGQYYYPYTSSATGKYYLMYAAEKTQIAGTDPVKYEYTMVARKYVSSDTVDYFETTPKNYELTAEKQLLENILGNWALVHIGGSQGILKALADETLNTLDGAIGTMKLSDVIEINDSSSKILQELKDSKIDNLADDIRNIKISAITEVTRYNIIDVATPEQIADTNVKKYVTLTKNYGTDYLGVFSEAYLLSDTEKTTPYYTVEYRSDYDYGTYADTSTIYVVVEEKSNDVVIYMSNISIGDLEGTDTTSLVNKAPIKGVMHVDGDVFIKAPVTYDSSTPDAFADYFVYFNKGGKWDDLNDDGIVDDDTMTGYFKPVDDSVIDGTDLYIRLYEGSSSVVIRKLALTPIYELADRIDNVVDNTKLKDIISIKDRTIVEKNGLGEYVQLKSGESYMGAYKVGYFDGDDTPVYYVKWDSSIDTSTLELEGGNPVRLNVVTKSDNGIMVKLADKLIGSLSSEMQGIIDATMLSEVIDMDGDVYREKNSGDTGVTAFYVIKNYFLCEATAADILDDSITKYVKVVTGSDNAIIKKLAIMPINKVAQNIGKVIDDTTLSEVVTINIKNILELSLTGDYIALKSGSDYYGAYNVGYLDGDDTPIYYVKYVAGLTSDDFETTRYNLVTKADNGVMCAMAAMKIGEMSSGMQSLINGTILSQVMDIEGDVYREKKSTDTSDLYVLDVDFFRLATTIEIVDDSIKKYVKVYDGSDSTIIKKLALIKIGDLSERMQYIIDETKLYEIITVQEKSILEVDSLGNYVALDSSLGVEFDGTINVGYLASDPGTDICYVRYYSGMDETYLYKNAGTLVRYSVVEEADNGIMSKISALKVKELSGEMQNIVNDTVLSDVIDISGDVYIALDYLTYSDYTSIEMLIAGGAEIFKKDTSNIFISAKSSDVATEDSPFYQKIYSGTSNVVLKKIATIKASALATGNTLNDAINDCELGDVITITDSTSILYQIKDAKVGNIDAEIKNVMTNATVRELNTWGNLGMSIDTLNKLNFYMYRKGHSQAETATYISDVTADANNLDKSYDIKAAEFLGNLHIDYDPVTGITITLS